MLILHDHGKVTADNIPAYNMDGREERNAPSQPPRLPHIRIRQYINLTTFDERRVFIVSAAGQRKSWLACCPRSKRRSMVLEGERQENQSAHVVRIENRHEWSE
jgi:hypothetical protein